MTTPRLCSVEGCGKPAISRTLCSKHYQRWQRHGDATKTNRYEGKPCCIPGCIRTAKKLEFCGAHYWRYRQHGDPLAGRTPEGEPLRYLNNIVLPYVGDECIVWPYGSNGAGYGLIWLDGAHYLVNRAICERIHGPPPSAEHEAAHTCGHGHLRCVNPGHIQWETPSENQMDRVNHDTHQRGERHPGAKLTEEQVRDIRLLEGKMTHQQIATRFNIGRIQVGRIISGARWGWLR